MIKLFLLGTTACHLCQEAELIIATCKNNRIEIEYIDIAEHEQWQEKYAIRIPVLYYPETKKELGWPFTLVQVRAFIKALK